MIDSQTSSEILKILQSLDDQQKLTNALIQAIHRQTIALETMTALFAEYIDSMNDDTVVDESSGATPRYLSDPNG